jgi:hypothetical protein
LAANHASCQPCLRTSLTRLDTQGGAGWGGPSSYFFGDFEEGSCPFLFLDDGTEKYIKVGRILIGAHDAELAKTEAIILPIKVVIPDNWQRNAKLIVHGYYELLYPSAN